MERPVTPIEFQSFFKSIIENYDNCSTIQNNKVTALVTRIKIQ